MSPICAILPSNALRRHVTIQYLRHVPTLCPTMFPSCRRDARPERPGNVMNTRPFPRPPGLHARPCRRHATRKKRRNKHLRNTGKGTPTEKREQSKKAAKSCKQKKAPRGLVSPRGAKSKKAASYSPASHRSTIGATGLNFSVRNGKRWNPGAIATKCWV